MGSFTPFVFPPYPWEAGDDFRFPQARGADWATATAAWSPCFSSPHLDRGETATGPPNVGLPVKRPGGLAACSLLPVVPAIAPIYPPGRWCSKETPNWLSGAARAPSAVGFSCPDSLVAGNTCLEAHHMLPAALSPISFGPSRPKDLQPLLPHLGPNAPAGVLRATTTNPGPSPDHTSPLRDPNSTHLSMADKCQSRRPDATFC